MVETAIATRRLVRRFGEKAAVDGIDLTIAAGGVVALVGPNGAGKTTLLHLLLGLLAPTEGGAELLGYPARNLPPAAARQVQAVGDRHEPPPAMRLDELMALQGSACPNFDKKLATEMIVGHGLVPSAQFGTLSKGQRRWALAALALASLPRLLIMDEPADGLDPSARRLLYEHLRQYVNEVDATVLVTSHVLSDLERVADDVVILRRGRVVLHDSLEGLRDEARELVLQPDEATPEWLDQVQVIGEAADGRGRRLWIRVCPAEGGRQESVRLLKLADRHAGVHRVNLESLYCGLVEGQRPQGDSTLAAAEVAPCS